MGTNLGTNPIKLIMTYFHANIYRIGLEMPLKLEAHILVTTKDQTEQVVCP